MAQLKMYWRKGSLVIRMELPAGFRLETYQNPTDRAEWVECCKNGLIADDAGEEMFVREIETHADICMETDVFFLKDGDTHIATATAVYHPDGNWGELHMVGMKTAWRGRGLAKYLVGAAVQKLAAQNVDFIELTTDEWRKGAIKSYLNAGFVPVEYDKGMEERWRKVLPEYGIQSIPMVREDASFYKELILD